MNLSDIALDASGGSVEKTFLCFKALLAEIN